LLKRQEGHIVAMILPQGAVMTHMDQVMMPIRTSEGVPSLRHQQATMGVSQSLANDLLLVRVLSNRESQQVQRIEVQG